MDIDRARSTIDIQGDRKTSAYMMNINYTVDFESKTGSGLINNLAYFAPKYDTLILQQGVLEKLNIDGITTYGIKSNIEGVKRVESGSEVMDGYYELGLYGPNAEEVAGRVVLNNYANNDPHKIYNLLYNGSLALNKNGGLEFGFAGQRGEITK